MQKQKFLGCRGYLPKAESLRKSPLEDATPKEILPPSILCQGLFSITNNLLLKSNRPNSPNSYNCDYDFYTFQNTEVRTL